MSRHRAYNEGRLEGAGLGSKNVVLHKSSSHLRHGNSNQIVLGIKSKTPR